MSAPASRSGTLASVAVSLLVLAATTWGVLREPAPPPAALAGLPPADELDSLDRYLLPVEPLPPLDRYEQFVPAAPEPTPDRGVAAAPPEPEPAWRVTAILLSGSNPVAIVNDRPVRPGDRLPDGSLVESIRRDQIILVAPSGRRHVLRLESGE